MRVQNRNEKRLRAEHFEPMACRCCGEPVYHTDGSPIHTYCIGKHWSKHNSGINASRCREFGGK